METKDVVSLIEKIDQITLKSKRDKEIILFLDNFSVSSINDCTPKPRKRGNENGVTVPAPSKNCFIPYSVVQKPYSKDHIDKLLKQEETLHYEVQKIACSIIKHVLDNDEARLVRMFIKKFPESMDKEAMIHFLCAFAPISINEKGVITYVRERKKECAELFSLCMNISWWEATRC